ncbi:YhbY family RNA-binding protein [Peptoniphilaceae bacterium SGI.131]
MINSKQRSFLKSMANTMEAKLNIGKNSLSDAVIKQLDDILNAHEIVKVKILNNNMDDQDLLIQEIIKRLGADFVSHVGSKFVLYRKSDKEIIELP